MTFLEEAKAILADLIAFPTVSTDSNLALIAYAAERLGDCGAAISVSRDDSGTKANLFATLGPHESGGVMLAGHSDVVPAEEDDWTSDPFTMREADGRLYGRGTSDMKGFIAAILAVAPYLAQVPLRRPVHVALTYDEEIGCHGARHLARDLGHLGVRPAVAIVGEPTEMRIVDEHKGCFEYTTVFGGLEGHSSVPEAGVNAVEYAARFVSQLIDLAGQLRRAADGTNAPFTTIQVGRIHGGSARNIIAGHCAVEWEMRPVGRRHADDVKSRIQDFCLNGLLPAMRAIAPEATITTETIGEIEGLESTEDNEARQLLAELLGDTIADKVAFGTEAGLYQSHGMDVAVCGPGSISQAHKADEFLAISQLDACLTMLRGLRSKLAG